MDEAARLLANETQRRYRQRHKDRINEKLRREYSPEEKLSQYLRQNYGITLEEYDSMYAEQGGKCDCCGDYGKSRGRGRLNVDHLHGVRNKVRSLLCMPCNLALGHLKESLDRSRMMTSYIKRRIACLDESVKLQ